MAAAITAVDFVVSPRLPIKMAHAEALSALADPTRRAIFETLRAGRLTVVELANKQTVSRPAVSQHLRVLEAARLVGVEPVDRRRFYYIRKEGLNELRDYLDSFWSDVLDAYGQAVAQRTKSR